MSISADYPSPINVNGFSCRNCTDVGYAEKNIDPAHPERGPFDINADKKAAKAEQQLFDRDRIDAAVAAAREADKRVEARANAQPYGSPQSATFPGQLINLAA